METEAREAGRGGGVYGGGGVSSDSPCPSQFQASCSLSTECGRPVSHRHTGETERGEMDQESEGRWDEGSSSNSAAPLSRECGRPVPRRRGTRLAPCV